MIFIVSPMHNMTTESIFESPEMQPIIKLVLMWTTLSSDVNLLEEPTLKENAQISFHRRQYVRAASALVEGLNSMMKQCALHSHEEFSPEEILILQEQEPYLDNGKVSLRERFIPIEKNIQFAFAAYARAHKAAFKIDCGGSGWQDFKKLCTIRNRITHPRKGEELVISDEELKSIKRALDFVSLNHSAVQEAIQKVILLRAGMPEPLFPKWLAWQQGISRAADQKEKDVLTQELRAEMDNYFRQQELDGIG